MERLPNWSQGQKKRRFLPWQENHCWQWKKGCPSKPVTAGQRKPVIHRSSVWTFLTVCSVAAHWMSAMSHWVRCLIGSRAWLKGASKCCLKGGIQTALSFWRFNVVGWFLELQQHGHLGNMQRQVKWPRLRMKYVPIKHYPSYLVSLWLLANIKSLWC